MIQVLKNLFRKKGSIPSIFLLSIGLGFSACQENASIGPDYTIEVNVLDSAYLYTQSLYYWNTALPPINIYQPRNFASVEEMMRDVRAYSPSNGQGGFLDRFTDGVPEAVWNSVASGDNSDFGCGFKFFNSNDLRISFVYPNSPADQADIRRSWQVKSINGINAIMDNSSSLNQALGGNSIDLVLLKPDETNEISLTLNRASYQSEFILNPKVIDIDNGNKKLGYFVLQSFLGADNGQATIDALDQTIQDFKSQGVNELAIDLRYNGGGYNRVAEHLANLIAPSSALGKTMYSFDYNQNYQSFERVVNFSSDPAELDLNRVYFITTSASASASELLINALRPYTEVKVVGDNTFGKPVGSLVVPVMDYVILPIAFRIINSEGEADYYDGILADIPQGDGLDKDFGDPFEINLDVIIQDIQGTLGRNATKDSELLPKQFMLRESDYFKGMIAQ